MSNVNRSETVTRKVKTQFGSMYIHMSVDDIGRPLGASISSPGKEPDSQISKFIDQLSINLDYLCASIIDGCDDRQDRPDLGLAGEKP